MLRQFSNLKRLHQITTRLQYCFARNTFLDNDLSLPLGEMTEPTISNEIYKSLLVMPIELPLFPYNSLVTRIHPTFQKIIQENQIQHIGAFLLKDGKESIDIKPEEFQQYFTKDVQVQEVKEEQPQTPQGGTKALVTLPIKEQVSEILDRFHQNIIYESSISTWSHQDSDPFIKMVSKIEDLHLIGTICKISFQKLNDQGRDSLVMILKGLQRIQIISKSSSLPAKYIKKTDILGIIKQKVTSRKEKKQPKDEIVEEEASPKLSEPNFLMVGNCQPIRDHAAQFTSDTNYKLRLTDLLGMYSKLRQKIPINVPELLNDPSDPSTIDTLCGFLCLTPYFDRSELITLFMTVPLHERLILCQSFFDKYSKELFKQWDTLQARTTVPVDQNTQNQKMKEIYDFLKKQFQSGQSSAFVTKIQKAIEGRQFPQHIQDILLEELKQISELSEQHPDFNNKRNFVELLVSLPFGVLTQDEFSLKKAEEVLKSSHFGLDQVKTRVLEFLAVSKLRGSPSGKTLLLSGPPGVGKTSVASTIAQCLGRKFVRVSLGGESDVAIIKGHRKTYMASYPGKIIQALKQAQSENPVILLDEIDKLGHSYRGNLSDALLEVLDPSQNNNFIDHYLEVGVDLSKVLFICSANLLDTIPAPLFDRMELIELSGYTLEEKLQIAQKHLIPKIIEDTGLTPYLKETVLTEELLTFIIQYYCRESGVRSLQRTISRLFEKLVIRIVKNQQSKVENNNENIVVTKDQLDDLIGLPPFDDTPRRDNTPGLGVGLAYNAYGGSLMYIEIVRTSFLITDQKVEEVRDLKGSPHGSLKITGQLGQTIKESVQIAYTHAKSILHEYFDNHFLADSQLHMHFPAGAVKKDGPSAGIAIASALVSMALNIPIKPQTAMTGEISLTGKVLKIGGLKEKVLAAKREGIKFIIIPEGNDGDYQELPLNLKQGITFYLVDDFLKVVNILFDKNFEAKSI